MAVLPKSVRLEKLRTLRDDSTKIIGKQKLYYKEASEQHAIYKVDLDWLVYNEHNGRLESEMLTWKAEHSTGSGISDTELDELIGKFLWNINIGKNKQTLDDLKEKGQQRPAIITLDGVIIDGNRRAMLLRKIPSQWIEAVILPDAYAENEKEIVKLETQYQMGEDSKLDYGALEKYLHVKRLKSLGIEDDDIAKLIGETRGEVERLLLIMKLMDEYLEHIDCAGLYTMLKQNDGTKEGMFVDLYQDLKRFNGGTSKLNWAADASDFDDLKTIHFDYIRFGGEFSDTGKTYREISHNGSGEKSFFSHSDIWQGFSEEHHSKIDPVTESIGSLDEYLNKHPEHQSRVDAARARDKEWQYETGSEIKRIFGTRKDALAAKVEVIEPRRLLSIASNALGRIDIDSPAFLSDASNLVTVGEINALTYEMRKRFSRKRS